MEIHKTELSGAVVIEPRVFEDSRGFFVETYQRQRYQAAGIDGEFIQDNYSRSCRGTIRGLHYQIQHAQGKLVQVVRGEIFDVAVDLRRSSPTFGKSVTVTLSESNHRQFYIPPGFAHGFCVTSDIADFFYKCTEFYYLEHERTLLWNDEQLGIEWPDFDEPILSEKDQDGTPLVNAECFE